jgi:two-component system CheB/CheR fusion protein
MSRRVRRRMALRGITHLEAYVDMLRSDPVETQALYQDLLIRVTSFFREPGAFEILQKLVFPRLLTGQVRDGPIRIWVAGCSTGEEVYSLAISLLEYLGDMASNTQVKILATDVNETALEKARAGIYLENIELDVNAERLRRFFVKVNHHYQISKTIRDMCIFSRHNLLRDPPYSRLDLVSCRNVLIYLDAGLQKQTVPMFHYALNPNGYLMLGTSETIGSFADMFELIDEHQKIYMRKGLVAPRHGLLYFTPADQAAERGRGDAASGAPVVTAIELQREADRMLQQLLLEQRDQLEAALWTAVRIFRERAVLSRQLAKQEHLRNPRAAQRFEEQGRLADQYADLIQKRVISNGAAERSPKEHGTAPSP